jgi:hypothetical protein
MSTTEQNDSAFPHDGIYETGITKREYFAAIALQGLLVNAERNGLSFFSASAEAVRQADHLILELNKNEDAKS